MELEKQVCSLDLAKKLKGLGVKQESCFIWVESANFGVRLTPENESFYLELHGSIARLASAFTTAELGEMLPKLDGRGWIETTRMTSTWDCTFCVSTGNDLYRISVATEADARAKMLLYLIENKLLN